MDKYKCDACAEICEECLLKKQRDEKYANREYKENDDNEEDNQLALFDVPTTWEEEWKGMPEFEQKNTEPFQSVIIHFKDKHDRDKFADMIGQKITYKTKFLYFPKDEPTNKGKVWADEEE